MDEDAPAGALTSWRSADPPPWSETGAWLLWGFLSCGLLVGAGFLWIGLRYKRRDWQRLAAFYGAAGVIAFAIIGTVVADVVWPFVWSVLVAGLVHSVVIQARQPRQVTFPQGPMVPMGYARSPVWPLPPGSYPPPWPYRPVPTAPRSAVVGPWAGFVRSAEGARERFRRCAARIHPGPLHEAVVDLAGRIDASVDECRRIAAGGRVLAEARAAIDTEALDVALRDAKARQAAQPDDRRAASTVAALQSQRSAAGRMDGVIDDTLGQLRLLDARLGEAVVRVLELSAQAEAADAVPQLSSDVDSLVADLEALRLAVEETDAADVLGPALPPARRSDPGDSAESGWDQPG